MLFSQFVTAVINSAAAAAAGCVMPIYCDCEMRPPGIYHTTQGLRIHPTIKNSLLSSTENIPDVSQLL